MESHTVKNTKAVTLVVILGMLAITNSEHSQVLQVSSSETTLTRGATTTRYRVTITDALTTALGSAGVPGGIVIIANCGDDPTYSFRSSGPTLRDALNAIVAVDSQYIWRLDGHVINVTPRRASAPLLSSHIRKLKIRNAHSVDGALNDVLNLLELRKRVRELNLTRGFMRIGLSDLARPGGPAVIQPSFSLNLKNVSLQEALNAIARADGKAVWQYRERRCNSKAEFQIEFLVR